MRRSTYRGTRTRIVLCSTPRQSPVQLSCCIRERRASAPLVLSVDESVWYHDAIAPVLLPRNVLIPSALRALSPSCSSLTSLEGVAESEGRGLESENEALGAKLEGDSPTLEPPFGLARAAGVLVAGTGEVEPDVTAVAAEALLVGASGFRRTTAATPAATKQTTTIAYSAQRVSFGGHADKFEGRTDDEHACAFVLNDLRAGRRHLRRSPSPLVVVARARVGVLLILRRLERQQHVTGVEHVREAR